MVSRTLPTSLILSLALTSVACGDDSSATSSTTTFTTTDTLPTETSDSDTNDETDTSMMSGDGDGDSTTDPATATDTNGDGDGDDTTDTTEGDGDGDDSTTGDGDGDDSDTEDMECLDLDQDGYGENCPMGPDCDDNDFYNHTVDGCANCADMDMDGYWVGCDQYDDNQPGEDCDDSFFNVFSDEGCANCADNDNDGVYVGCDQYGDDGPGPDCDDNNPVVGLEDAQEICNGEAENCAGEVDNAPPDEMCPPEGVDAPNVAPMNGWGCAGVDGCFIQECVEQYFDLDNQIQGGCECEGTPRTDSLGACSGAPQGYLGAVGESEQLPNLVVGTIPLLDNGIGAGREDWYWVDFEENDANGVRPNTGSIQVSFAVNQGNDYRFQVYRSCEGVAWSGSLTENLQQADPALEWWFYDDHQFGSPINNVSWPDTVYIRVFRVQNDLTCNNYQLSVQRLDN